MKLILCLLTLFLALPPAAMALNLSPGETPKDFRAVSLDGHSLSLSQQKKKAVIILYWKADNERSLKAVLDAQEIAGKYPANKVQVLSILADDENRMKVSALVRDNQIEVPVLFDRERAIYGDYGIRVYPTTLILDTAGKLVFDVSSHPQNFKTLLKGYLAKALGELDDAGLQEALNKEEIVEDHASSEMNRLYNLGLKFSKTGMGDMAIMTTEKAVAAKPDAVKAHVLLGFLQLKNENVEKARVAFEEALKIDPRNRDALTGLGSVLLEQGDHEKALTVLQEALQTNPYPQWTYFELGRTYEALGDKDASIRMFKKSMEKFIEEHILPADLSRCK